HLRPFSSVGPLGPTEENGRKWPQNHRFARAKQFCNCLLEIKTAWSADQLFRREISWMLLAHDVDRSTDLIVQHRRHLQRLKAEKKPSEAEKAEIAAVELSLKATELVDPLFVKQLRKAKTEQERFLLFVTKANQELEEEAATEKLRNMPISEIMKGNSLLPPKRS
ncbi:MAG: hypothetical protein KGJ02_06405, partial [Verrucomicrobiota bacterium]|nr:hypothetical protein [Verrucomicrobiota bacterium]